jgi:hypothetical protein
MNRSFAHNSHARHVARSHITRLLLPITSAILLGACATLPPPTSELAAAQDAVAHATGVDADQYAGDTITQARSELSQAQAAMAQGRDDDARALAVAAASDAELASATSVAAATRAEYTQHRNEIVELHHRLQIPGEAPPPSALDASGPTTPIVPPAVGTPNAGAEAAAVAGRLQTLEADPRLNAFAAYERLRAHQAVDAIPASGKRGRDNATRIAELRVAIAELAARTEATRREIDRLERERSELLVEASRQDAERARQEAEQLRVQAQVQAEETQRLRAQADAATAAQQQAENAIVDVTNDQTAKLAAAKDKEAALARQEADLLAGKSTSADKPKPGKRPKTAVKKKIK